MKGIHKTILLLAPLLLASCAKQGYPSGGPVDKQPPVVKAVLPESETTNFQAKKFRLDFDEYVVMKDADNNVLISPPMASKPEYSTKGHSLIVKLTDSLASNTTYLFQFKGAIVDFNEGNPLPSFEYVFSTGPQLDSMTLSGKVLDALSQQPPDGSITIVAHEITNDCDTLGDSIVAKAMPAYQTRSAADGSFCFNYIRPGSYRIFALDDSDKNLRYSASEAIAWLDSTVTPTAMPKKATNSVSEQPILSDSSFGHPILLQLSLKEVLQQRVTSKQFTSRGCVQITTQSPLQNPTVEADSVVWTLSADRDTLSLWTLQAQRDSIHIVLTDSATALTDTIVLKYREPKKNRRNDESQMTMNTISPLIGSSHPWFDTMRVRFEAPLATSDPDSVAILMLSDSSLTYASLQLDTVRVVAQIVPSSPLKQGEKYRISIPAGICRDIYGRYNDSLSVVTTLTSSEDYGILSIDITKRPDNQTSLIAQLLGEKDAVVRQLPVEGSTITFSNLKPASYRVRLVYDLDGDGHWTPGDYYLRQQPEPVVYFPKTLQLRANWEMSETWEL